MLTVQPSRQTLETLLTQPSPLRPLIRHQAHSSNRGEQAVPPQRAAHLLIVDAEPVFRHFLQLSLQADGYAVSTAGDRQTALMMVQTLSIDLVLLDLQMPGVDGYALCTELRTFSAIPVIILSALRDPVDMLLGFRAGADDYLPKPFPLREIELRVQRLLHRVKAK